MSSQEIRIFNVQRNRNGSVVDAGFCNGESHFSGKSVPFHGSEEIFHVENWHTTCDNNACKSAKSEVVDLSRFTASAQHALDFTSPLAPGLVLLVQWPNSDIPKTYSSGQRVAPKELEAGRILGDNEGAVYIWRYNRRRYVYYIRNNGGKVSEVCVGREDRNRTKKKLAKLRVGERQSYVSNEATTLNEHLLALMQLHRTPEVVAAIENVKELLRLAGSLSVEASIDAIEGNEEIAKALSNERARQIGVDLELIRDRLNLELKVREGLREEQIN